VFSGWLFFVYQDGRVTVLSHYTAAARGDGTFTLATDTTSQPFPFAYQSPGPGGAESAPIGPGHSYSGTYGAGVITLADCQSYLYFASPANTPVAQSCTFTYNGSSVQ